MDRIGTSQRPLYFLHIPKTGGSTVTRLLDDAFPAGSRLPATFVDDYRDLQGAELERYPLLCGHFGRLPFETIATPVGAVTLVRDPTKRAWSHYRALRFSHHVTSPLWRKRAVTFRDFLDDPTYGWTAANFQARWLAVVPERDLRGPATPGLALAAPFGPGPLPFDDETLTRRALATFDRCTLVGTTERLPEFVAALSRLLGRWLPEPPVVNAGPGGGDPSPEEAKAVFARSSVDVRLVEHAHRRLDHALATLPAIDAVPVTDLPYEQTMADSFTGRGWYARVRTDTEGWHRWSGPDTVSSVQFPVRLAGPARLEIAVVSSCDRAVVEGLRLRVQDRPTEHRLADHSAGVVVMAEIDLRADRPVVLEITVPYSRALSKATIGAEPEPAALAVGTIRFVHR